MPSGETSGTTATFVIVDGWTVTVASVGDSRCILDTQGGAVSTLTVDHRLEENVEEYVSIMNTLFLALPRKWVCRLIGCCLFVGENVLLQVVEKLGALALLVEQR